MLVAPEQLLQILRFLPYRIRGINWVVRIHRIHIHRTASLLTSSYIKELGL